MAGQSVIGALRVVLGADTAALDKGLKDSQSKLGAFGTAVTAGMAAVAAGVAAASVSIVGSIQRAIDSADKMNKLSQSTGLTTQELSKLSYAAELADVSGEALGKSMGKLSKAMTSAAVDGAGPAGQAFKDMGVVVKNQDGTMRSSSDVLSDVAGKFENYRDGAAKTALAIELFGKAGAAMIPLLNLGKDGLKQSADEAERYGLVLDKKTTVAAENFNDNLKRMDKIKEGLFVTMTAKLLPSFETLSAVMLKSREESQLWSKIGDGLATVMQGIVTVGIALITTWERIFATASNLMEGLSQLTKGEFTAGFETMKKSATETSAAFSTLGERVQMMWKPDATDQAMKEMSASVDGFMGTVRSAGEFLKKDAPLRVADTTDADALKSYLANQAKKVAAQNAETETVGKSVGEQARLRLAYEATQIAISKGIALGPAQVAAINAAAAASAQAALNLEAANIKMQVMNPADKFANDMARLQEVYQTTNMTMETFAARQQQIAEAAGATWGQASESIAGSFATISSSFSKESSAMATAAKVFGVIQGTISMFTGAAKALELPFPANIAAVAAVLAKGASLVASIKSQSVPTGMMTGGSFTVPGSGGPDSQRVALDLSPGEQVDVWRPEQGGGADPRRGAGGAQPINLSMPIAVTRDAFRALIDGLNDMTRDGYRLNVVPA
ncbi:hypothetical protein [Bradyrhizobium sp. AUGA SZCCT0160]|uniref:hypothetical protein n=1 Tax=Bradyrhizobium sp. AUGA SZCCT0160 TaxID=2807662 RepID=UPI001BAB423F|nr:hypothetical protein [Bradyrhizobium sp. AUGA SZCCT0160]MBR1193241.1 hypothetical protein [Bradyrhizobium sp. AUGA SZCCT0160]